VDLRSLGVDIEWNDAAERLAKALQRHLTP
jgi:hypothetical protein